MDDYPPGPPEEGPGFGGGGRGRGRGRGRGGGEPVFSDAMLGGLGMPPPEGDMGGGQFEDAGGYPLAEDFAGVGRGGGRGRGRGRGDGGGGRGGGGRGRGGGGPGGPPGEVDHRGPPGLFTKGDWTCTM